MLDSADVISTVEFDSTGNYLATGDKGGRVVLFERNEQVRSLPFLRPCALPQADRIPFSLLNRVPLFLRPCRRRTANTSFTQSSNRMSPSSIISSLSRSRRRLTRSSGADGRILLTSCCLLTVRVWWVCHTNPRPRSEEINRIAYLGSPTRQDHQAMEGFRKIAPCCIGIQPLGWPKKFTNPTISFTSPIAKDDPTRQHYRCRSPQGLRQRSCIPHPLHLHQF